MAMDPSGSICVLGNSDINKTVLKREIECLFHLKTSDNYFSCEITIAGSCRLAAVRSSLPRTCLHCDGGGPLWSLLRLQRPSSLIISRAISRSPTSL